ncbi:MAG: acyl--CoA ligase, partial [Spirochaetales bacterium]|nr:acyl--CoA ligase [Spirochaetales bacterium]
MTHFSGLFDTLSYVSKKSENKEMLIIDNDRITYGDFILLCNRISCALIDEGIEKGDRIAILLPNHPYWYSIFWAISRIGAVPVPFDPQSGSWELAQLINFINVRFCFAIEKYRGVDHYGNIKKIIEEGSSLKKAVFLNEVKTNNFMMTLESFIQKKDYSLNFTEIYHPDFTDELMYACTSGTTGNPKILVVQQGGFFQAEYDMADYLALNETDTMLVGMPLYHQGGFGMGLQAAITGGKIIYQSRFDPYKFLTIIEQERVSVVQLTSTLAKILFSVPEFNHYNLSSLRLVYFAGEVLPREIMKRFVHELNTRVVNIIGSSETATMLVWDSDKDLSYDCNSYRRLDFTDVKLVDNNGNTCKEGEIGMIHIHTDAVLLYYYNNPLETSEKIYIEQGKRWYITGDLGKKLAHDRILFIGREKRVIKRGANLVYPEEIESFLLTHPDIEGVAVTLKKDAFMGEAIIAIIQKRKDVILKKGDIIHYCKGRLSGYKIP